MKKYNINFPSSLWNDAKKKAGIIPLSVVIRQLVQMWVNGDIEIKY